MNDHLAAVVSTIDEMDLDYANFFCNENKFL